MTGEEMLIEKLRREENDRLMAQGGAARTFSKMKVVAALTNLGVWAQVKEWMQTQGLYDLYLAAQDFAEDDKNFLRGRAELQAALGLTDEQVEEILAASVAE